MDPYVEGEGGGASSSGLLLRAHLLVTTPISAAVATDGWATSGKLRAPHRGWLPQAQPENSLGFSLDYSICFIKEIKDETRGWDKY